MAKVIIYDSGRSTGKGICDGERILIPSVVSPAREFTQDVKLNAPDYFWIRYLTKWKENPYWQESFVGKLALDKSKTATQDRSRQKDNENNLILIVNAVSYFADDGDEIILLTNCPTRDWAKQRKQLSQSLCGEHAVIHKAGIKAGNTVRFRIIQAHILPEGIAAFYGHVYDENLNTIQENTSYLDGESLIISIGDETTEYVVFKDGECLDDESGSLDKGARIAHAALQSWLEGEGIELTHAQITSYLMQNKPVRIGGEEVNIIAESSKRFNALATIIFNMLSGKFKFNRFRNILLSGGASFPVYNQFCKEISKEFVNQPNRKPNIDCYPDERGQWLTAVGMERMYQQMLREMGQGA